MQRLIGRFTSAFLLSMLVPAIVAAQAPATSPPAQSQQTFSKEQLDQMMAPIALYPDSLLSQVLMAATYPADVVEASKWSKAHKDDKGEAAVKAVEGQPWDPAVKALIAFPQVIQMMGDKPDWVQNLGDAFLASSKDVLDSAQRLRAQAQKAGNLKSSEQQKVVVEQEPQTQQTIIKIEPTNPQTVYVPAYNPTVVYGAWPYPAYPPYYYPPSPYYYPGAALATGFAWGVGIAAGAALWGNANWGGGDVNINTNRYNTINSNRQIDRSQSNFQHNSENRRGTPYRDSGSQQKYGKNVAGADQRQDYRGRDPARDSQRQQAQNTLQQRGMDPSKERDALRNDPATRDRAQQAARDTNRGGAGDRGGAGGGQGGFDRGGAGGGQGGFDRGGAGGGQGGFDRGGAGGASASQRQQGLSGSDNAFRNAGNSAQTRQQVDRGSASRQSMNSRPSGGGGGARAGGGGGGRGGGGGGGGRGGGGRR